MNTRQKEIYENNLRHATAILGVSLETILQEQYYYKGILDKESMGTLKIKLTSGEEFTFQSDGNVGALYLKKGGFSDKGSLESDFDDNRYQWKEVAFLTSEKLSSFGKITNISFQESRDELTANQCGCKMEFYSGDYLYLWTVGSDNIFYAINTMPLDHAKACLKTIFVK